MGSGKLPETAIYEYSSQWHPQMQVEALSCKEEAVCEHDPETPPPPAGQNSFKTDWGKVENCSVFRWIKTLNSFLEKMDTKISAVKKRGSVWLVISTQFRILQGGCNSKSGSLHIWKARITAERFQRNFVPDDVFFRDGLAHFSKTILNCTLHLLQWLHSRRVWVLNCNPKHLPTGNIWHYEVRNMTKKI